jgi:hypothetical protein
MKKEMITLFWLFTCTVLCNAKLCKHRQLIKHTFPTLRAERTIKAIAPTTKAAGTIAAAAQFPHCCQKALYSLSYLVCTN